MKGIVTLLSFVLILAGCEKKKEAQQQPKVNDLPAMVINTTHGQPIFTKNLSGKIILILFQPDCDHCQREARQIRENLEAFREYSLYFISTSEPAELEKFSNEYQFSGQPKIYFAYTSLDYILNSLGSIEAPSVFVYSSAGKLIKHFNGEVDIAEILKVL